MVSKAYGPWNCLRCVQSCTITARVLVVRYKESATQPIEKGSLTLSCGFQVGRHGKTGLDVTLSVNELFEAMCAWDDENYILAAGTRVGSDSEDTDGIVDGHAYTVLECINDVAGTEFDLIKVLS